MRSLTGLDIVALAVSAISLLLIVACTFMVLPHFASMFADFGGELPAVTRLVLTPWFPPAMGLIAPAIAAEAIARHQARTERLIVAIVLAVALPTLGLIGLYLPIFTIAGSIK